MLPPVLGRTPIPTIRGTYETHKGLWEGRRVEGEGDSSFNPDVVYQTDTETKGYQTTVTPTVKVDLTTLTTVPSLVSTLRPLDRVRETVRHLDRGLRGQGNTDWGSRSWVRGD